MAGRYRGGRLAPVSATSDQLVRVGEQVASDYRKSMDGLAVHEGAAAAYRLIDATNEYLASTTPWTLAKDPSMADRLTQVLFDAAEAIRLSAVLLSPIMPASSSEILRRVGSAPDGLTLQRDGYWRHDGVRVLAQQGPLWPRTEPSKEEIRVTDHPIPPDQPSPGARPSPGPTTPAPAQPRSEAAAPPPERISIDDFMKVELRVAKVIAAERVPKSKKLLKLQVDVGTEHRTLVAGIAEAYEPEALLGRSVVIVFNLQPATLMGVESNGMVLAASPEGGKPIVVCFDNPPPPGTRVR
jgi:methionyl-tRNA synthetase